MSTTRIATYRTRALQHGILIGDSHTFRAHRGSGVNYQFEPNDKTFKTNIVPRDIADCAASTGR
jgi:hypothetical protein